MVRFGRIYVCNICGYSEEVHNIHVRNLSHEAYERLWNLRKFHKARSWADLIDKITKEYVEQIMEFEWI